MTDLIRQHLPRAKQHMKKMADQHRSARTFTVGDWVFLKMQPYVWSSLDSRSSHKLSFKYFGPFQVLERVGTVVYKLLLPPSSSVHPVFHVSQLKKVLPPDTQHLRDAQLFMIEDATTPASVKIINTCLRRVGNFVVLHTLVQWGDPPITWSS